jgi:tRNA pseudouridine65 synthase
VQILFRDDTILAVDKPSGLIVHRGMANDDDSVADRVRDLMGHRVHAVHRLDRGTSGVLLFALNPDAARAMQEQLSERRVEKTYWALTRGIPKPASGVIDHPIPKAEGKERVPALSEYRLLGVCLNRYAWVEVHPKTGRFHQVRRHMRHLSCPLIGDANYGSSEHNRLWRDRYGLGRLALHAASVSFEHPVTKLMLTIDAPLAADIAQALARAELTQV